MTPLARLVRKAAQKVAGVWYEGPKPPQRISKLVLDFAHLHPEATRREWVVFAAKLGQQCYRDGFTRGFENVERDPDPSYLELPPELVADAHDEQWRARPIHMGPIEEPDAVPVVLANDIEEIEPSEIKPEKFDVDREDENQAIDPRKRRRKR